MDHSSTQMKPAWKPLLGGLAMGVAVVCLSGCSLFVMAGKMFMGDPVVPSDFRLQTGVRLSKDGKRLVVICTAPESIKSELPSLQLDLTESIHHHLNRNGIAVVEADRVANWMNEVGGLWPDPSDLAKDIDTDYIAQIDIEDLSFREPNSTAMYRGRAHGTVSVYEVKEDGDSKRALQTFSKEFRIEYPRHHPMSADQISASAFQQRFLGDLTAYLARYFHDYRPGSDF